MKLTGKIESKIITEGMGKNNLHYKRCEFIIKGLKFSTFKKEWIDEFNEGDIAEIETELKNGYESLKSMLKTQPDASKEKIKDKPQEFHQSIEACRYEALDIAVKIGLKEDKSLFIVADTILNYILKGEKPIKQ